MKRNNPKSWRELRGQLRALGARPVRNRGSHEVWKFDDGETFVAVVNHVSDSVDANLLSRFRRLRARRRDPGEPPPLPGWARSLGSRPRRERKQERNEQR